MRRPTKPPSTTTIFSDSAGGVLRSRPTWTGSTADAKPRLCVGARPAVIVDAVHYAAHERVDVQEIGCYLLAVQVLWRTSASRTCARSLRNRGGRTRRDPPLRSGWFACSRRGRCRTELLAGLTIAYLDIGGIDTIRAGRARHLGADPIDHLPESVTLSRPLIYGRPRTDVPLQMWNSAPARRARSRRLTRTNWYCVALGPALAGTVGSAPGSRTTTCSVSGPAARRARRASVSGSFTEGRHPSSRERDGGPLPRRLPPRSSVAVAGPAAAAARAHAHPAFDARTAPSDRGRLTRASPYRALGIYLGGVPCVQGRQPECDLGLDDARVGLEPLPLYVGLSVRERDEPRRISPRTLHGVRRSLGRGLLSAARHVRPAGGQPDLSRHGGYAVRMPRAPGRFSRSSRCQPSFAVRLLSGVCGCFDHP